MTILLGLCCKIFENIIVKLLAQKKLPKWLRNICITKKCVFNNLKKVTHYNNGSQIGVPNWKNEVFQVL